MFDNLQRKRELFNYFRRLTSGSDFSNSILVYDDGGSNLFRYVFEFVMTLYCDSGSEFYCGKCSKCRLILQFLHPNIRLIIPSIDEDSSCAKLLKVFGQFFSSGSMVNLASWSDVLKSQKKQMIIPKSSIIDVIEFVNGEYLDDCPRICLLWGPEFLNVNSANSILKILEEPREKCFFILISENVDNILPTIRSRVVKFFFSEYFEFVPDVKLVDVFLEMLRVSFSFKYEKLSVFIDVLSKYGRNYVVSILKSGLFFLDDLLYCKFGLDARREYDDRIFISLKRLCVIFDFKFIEVVACVLEDAILLLNSNANLRFVLFNLIYKVGIEKKRRKNSNY